MLFRGRGVDDGLDLGDAVGGEAALLCVLAHGGFVGGDVDAVDFRHHLTGFVSEG